MRKLVVNAETGAEEYVDLAPEEIAEVEACRAVSDDGGE